MNSSSSPQKLVRETVSIRVPKPWTSPVYDKVTNFNRFLMTRKVKIKNLKVYTVSDGKYLMTTHIRTVVHESHTVAYTLQCTGGVMRNFFVHMSSSLSLWTDVECRHSRGGEAVGNQVQEGRRRTEYRHRITSGFRKHPRTFHDTKE